MSEKCFVIMPFGEKMEHEGTIINFDDVYNYILKDVIENTMKFQCIRCDEIPNPGWIHKDMIELILFSDIVIADLTTLNPNVFYELGIRHALRKNITVLIKKRNTVVPFNIRGLRIIDYDLDFVSATKTKKALALSISTSIANNQTDSLVYDVLPSLTIQV